MKGIRIVLITILSMIVFGLTLLLVMNITGRLNFNIMSRDYTSDWRLSGFNTYSYLQNTTNLELFDMEKLEIDCINSPFDVIILPSNGNELIIEEYYNAEILKEKMARIEQIGNNLIIRQQYYLPSTDIRIRTDHRLHGYIKVYIPAKSFSALKELSINCTSGDITLPEWDELSEGDSRLELTILKTVSGDIRTNSIESHEMQLSSISGDIRSTILIGNIKVNTTSGDYRTESIKGNLSITSVSGDIGIHNIVGNMDAKSTSGDISINSAAGDLILESNSGEIRVISTTGSLEVESTSGDITAKLEKWQGDIYVNSISGDVRLTLPKESSFIFKADSVSGDINTAYDNHLSFNKRRTEAEGTIGENAKYRMEIKTTSGDITLR